MKIDSSGNSTAFYLVNSLKKISKKEILKLKLFSKKNKQDSRICLHDYKSKSHQIMIINKVKKKNDEKIFFTHKFDKLFLIIDGKIKLKIKNKYFILSKNDKLIMLLKKNTKSSTTSLTNSSTYLEIIFRK